MPTPAPGLALIKRPTLAQSMGRITLLGKTVEGWSAGQAELIAIGPPAIPDDPEEETWPVDERLVAGTWLLTRFRSWLPTDDPNLFVIRQEDILAILSTNGATASLG